MMRDNLNRLHLRSSWIPTYPKWKTRKGGKENNDHTKNRSDASPYVLSSCCNALSFCISTILSFVFLFFLGNLPVHVQCTCSKESRKSSNISLQTKLDNCLLFGCKEWQINLKQNWQCT